MTTHTREYGVVGWYADDATLTVTNGAGDAFQGSIAVLRHVGVYTPPGEPVVVAAASVSLMMVYSITERRPRNPPDAVVYQFVRHVEDAVADVCLDCGPFVLRLREVRFRRGRGRYGGAGNTLHFTADSAEEPDDRVVY